ncbi:MAG: hypothetical protein ACYC1M_08085 [Armatimonadota bacterium]
MFISVCLAALVICLPSIVMTALAARKDGLSRVLPHGWIISESAVALLIVLSLVTKEPASPGQGLWAPLLLGALVGRLITKLALNLKSHSVAASAMLTLPTIALAALYLLRPGYPTPAMLGFTLGALICMVPIGLHTAPESWERRRIEISAMALVLGAAGVLLAIAYHPKLLPHDPVSFFWGWPIMLISLGGLAMLFNDSLKAMIGWSAGVTLVATVAFQLVKGNTLSLAVGIATALLPMLLYCWLNEAQKGLSPRPIRIDTPALAGGLLAIALAAMGFRDARGYGQVIAAVPLLIVATPLLVRSIPGAALLQRLLHSMVLVVVALALIRVPLQQMLLSEKMNLQYFNDLISLLIGTFLITAMPAIDLERWAESAFVSLVTVTIYLVTPLALMLIWGDRAMVALLSGMIVGMSFRAMKLESLGTSVAVFLAIFSAALFGPVLSYLPVSREVQIGLVVVMAVCLLVALWRSLRVPGTMGEEAAR